MNRSGDAGSGAVADVPPGAGGAAEFGGVTTSPAGAAVSCALAVPTVSAAAIAAGSASLHHERPPKRMSNLRLDPYDPCPYTELVHPLLRHKSMAT